MIFRHAWLQSDYGRSSAAGKAQPAYVERIAYSAAGHRSSYEIFFRKTGSLLRGATAATRFAPSRRMRIHRLLGLENDLPRTRHAVCYLKPRSPFALSLSKGRAETL